MAAGGSQHGYIGLGSPQDASWLANLILRVSNRKWPAVELSNNNGTAAVVASTSRLDAAISGAVFDLLDAIGVNAKHQSPITRNFPFVSSPTPVVLSVAAYLAVVTIWCRHIRATDLRPRPQDPRALHLLVIFHNLFLCLLSLFMGVGIISEAWKHNFSLWGNSPSHEHVTLGCYIYMFYLSKLYEFADTAIMLFRRNLRQVTYLHVYHHASISLIWWLISYTSPVGDAYFSAAFNSWVHVAMYLYYLLAATVAKDTERRRRYLWWGKYLTMMQMLQFVSFIGQAVYLMARPHLYPRGIPTLLFFYSISLLAFFGDFFVRKYHRAARSRAAKEE